MRDENDLNEILNRNPDLRRRNPDLCNTGDTPRTRNTRIADSVVLRAEAELREQAEAMLEGALQSGLRRIALAAGYLYYHTHNSRRSDSGFPDTVLLRIRLRTAQFYFVECKKQNENPSDEQQKWIEALRAFEGRAGHFLGLPVIVKVFVWRPMDLLDGTIERTLENEHTPALPRSGDKDG